MTKLSRALSLSVLFAGFSPFAQAGFNYDFHLSSAAIAKTCADAKAKTGTRLNQIAGVPPAQATLQNSLFAFANALADLSDETSIPMFLGQVAVDKSVRDAGMACDTQTSQYLVEMFSRDDVYKVLKTYADKKEPLDAEESRLLRKALNDFKRTGLELPPDQRAKLKDIKQKIVAIQNQFNQNLAEEKTTLSFTREQLAGLPDDYISRLAKDGDKYKVSLDYPDYYPFAENAKDAEARRLLQTKFDQRGGPANAKLMGDALELRAELARMLGYPTYAAYVLEDHMAKNPETVLNFLQDVQKKLKEKALPELKNLQALKNKELGAKSDGVIHAWDWRYYDQMLIKEHYQVDDQKIKEYFPVDIVTSGLLDVYQKLFGLKFHEIRPAGAWYDDVQLFEVTDDAKHGELIGYFYMDLFPREGKYKHAASFTLVPGRLMADGTRQKPVSAIVANFNKPTAAAPSLLTHNEVETFFHEFGHVMQELLDNAKYERIGPDSAQNFSISQDFVEAPSQMLENWVWREDVLKKLSGYYKDKKTPLPKPMLDKMIAAKNADSGLKNLRQVFFGVLDMTYHTQPIPDLTATWSRLMESISLIPMNPDTYPEANFGHLMDGYDAGYYGYLWSKVYAQDMFSRFEKDGVLNPETGLQYRRIVLAPGWSVDEADSLRKFLGREPNQDAFLKDIGLELKTQ